MNGVKLLTDKQLLPSIGKTVKYRNYVILLARDLKYSTLCGNKC